MQISRIRLSDKTVTPSPTAHRAQARLGVRARSAHKGARVAAASPLQQAQYAERRTRHGVVKCYREFVIGPYRCNHFW